MGEEEIELFEVSKPVDELDPLSRVIAKALPFFKEAYSNGFTVVWQFTAATPNFKIEMKTGKSFFLFFYDAERKAFVAVFEKHKSFDEYGRVRKGCRGEMPFSASERLHDIISNIYEQWDLYLKGQYPLLSLRKVRR